MKLSTLTVCPRCGQPFDRHEFADGMYLRIHCRRCRVEMRVEKLRRAIAAIERDRDAARAMIREARMCAGDA